MNARAIAALALLLAAVGLERLGYYTSRAFLSIDLMRSGETASSAGTLFAALRLATIVGIVAGGVVALGLGARATAALGALLAAAGHLTLALGAPIAVGAGLIAFGAGVLRPCPVSAAAALLAWDDRGPSRPGPHRFAAVAAFATLAYVAINAGGVLGPAIAGLLRQAYSFAMIYGVSAGLLLLATIAAAIAALLGLGDDDKDRTRRDQGPYRVPEPVQPSAPLNAGLAFAGLAILLAPEVVSMMGRAVSEPPTSILSGPNGAWIFTVNPVATGFTALLVFAVLLVAALQRSTRPPLQLYGLGLVIFGLGLVFAGVVGVGVGGDAVGVFAVGEAVRGVGEAAMYGVPVAYAAIAVRGPNATLVVAGWLAASSVLGLITNALGAVDLLRALLLWLCVLAALGGGVALLAFGKKMHGAFFDPPEPSFSARS